VVVTMLMTFGVVASQYGAYNKITNKYCSRVYGYYTNLDAAKADCLSDDYCTYVYDFSCNNHGPFYLCSEYKAEISRSGSCLYKKRPGFDPPTCVCINPFTGTNKEYKGIPDALCGSGGPGFCYVNCDGGCSDQAPTANPSRCQSKLACDVNSGTILERRPPPIANPLEG